MRTGSASTSGTVPTTSTFTGCPTVIGSIRDVVEVGDHLLHRSRGGSDKLQGAHRLLRWRVPLDHRLQPGAFGIQLCEEPRLLFLGVFAGGDVEHHPWGYSGWPLAPRTTSARSWNQRI